MAGELATTAEQGPVGSTNTRLVCGEERGEITLHFSIAYQPGRSVLCKLSSMQQSSQVLAQPWLQTVKYPELRPVSRNLAKVARMQNPADCGFAEFIQSYRTFR